MLSLAFWRIIGWYREQYVRVNGQSSFKTLFCQVKDNAPHQLAPTQTQLNPAALGA